MVAGELSPLVVIVGETASGKSSLAMDLAKRFNGELICADSWTVYEGFDIGTAKPSLEERRQVPHHLINVTTADKGFSAPQFKRLAQDAINDISSRHKLPILVGGTGLYVDSVIYDYSFLPPSSSQLRDELNKMTLEQLNEKARALELPLESIDSRNKRRVIRLIENDGRLPSKSRLRGNTLLLGISLERDELAKRIMSRTDEMINDGLEKEVSCLADKYGWDCEPMKGIGYLEWKDYLSGHDNLDNVRDKIIRSTLDLAKKQRTWFRRNKSIHWIDKQRQAVDLVTTLLNK